MSESLKNKRIITNTIFLYFRMILVLLISLYTSRLVLHALGIEGFGIYNVVAGVVTALSFLTGAMSASTQRFLSYEEGLVQGGRAQAIFGMSLNIHFILLAIAVILAETIGLWVLNNELNIPINRLYAANWVYQCTIVSFCFTILGIPYIAAIITTEKMGAFAYIGIIEVLLKLIVAFSLSLNFGDNLIIYSLLLTLSSIFTWFLYYFYCYKKISYTKYSFHWEKILFIKLTGFTGWNLIGNLSLVAMNQGLNILLNIFFGPAINASRAVSTQVNMAIRGFSSNLQMSMNPLITKSYASNNHDYMQLLVLRGSKYSFFLLLLLTLPVLLRTEFILTLWLGVLPEKVVVFCQLALIDSLVISLSGTLITAAQANGNIKKYQITTGGLLLINLPLTYFLLSSGAAPETALYTMVLISIFALFVRLLFLRKMINLSIKKYFSKVLYKVVFVSIVSITVMLYLNSLIGSSFLSVILIGFSSFVVVLVAVYFLGLDTEEQQFINEKCSRLSENLRKTF